VEIYESGFDYVRYVGDLKISLDDLKQTRERQGCGGGLYCILSM
jgi:hypothetical protein